MSELYFSLIFIAVFWIWCIFAIEQIDGHIKNQLSLF